LSTSSNPINSPSINFSGASILKIALELHIISSCLTALHIIRREGKVKAAGILSPELYGSREGHGAVDLAVKKVLAYDFLCQLK